MAITLVGQHACASRCSNEVAAAVAVAAVVLHDACGADVATAAAPGYAIDSSGGVRARQASTGRVGAAWRIALAHGSSGVREEAGSVDWRCSAACDVSVVGLTAR